MNKHDLIMLALGALAGSVVTGVAGYIYVNHKYTPLREINETVQELEKRKNELIKQNLYTEKVIKTKTQEHEKKIAELEDQELRLYDSTTTKASTYSDFIDEEDDALDALREDMGHPEERHSSYFQEDGRFVIDEGNSRWDGPLTDDEQAEFNECEGDSDMEHTVLDSIRRKRYQRTIPNKHMYRINEKEHQNRPDWFDTITIDYYETDDIFAEGTMIVNNIAGLIDVTVLNHFDPDGTVWCRNEKLECDYEIVDHAGSWQNAVMHIPEDQVAPVHKYNKELADKLEE